jgi:hypothetical protein
MADETSDTNPTGNHDLRAITVRLTDLQRKCRSASARNDEALEIEHRLGSVLERLKMAEGPDEETPPFGALARELYAVERFFESNGFLSVAKEVAHVERALEALSSPEEEPEISLPERALADADTTGFEAGDADDGIEEEPTVSRWAVPKPLAATMALFVVAIAVCAFIIYRFEFAEPKPLALDPLPMPVPTVVAPTPSPTVRSAAPPGPAPGAVLAEAVGDARLSLAEGDVDATIDSLSRAAIIDPDHSTVLATAGQLVDLLVDRANGAAENGLWEIADLTLARAERLATRYGLDTQKILDARYRHSRMERFRLVQASDRAAIRAATGQRVTVVLKDGSTEQSIIKGVADGHLLLNEDTTVRGGAVYYVERIPLVEIDYLKVWEE